MSLGMRLVNAYEATSHLSRLLDEVDASETILLAMARKPRGWPHRRDAAQ